MKRSKSPSFVLTLKLNTNKADEHILNHRFWCAQQIHNALVRHCIKQITKLRSGKLYRELLDSYIKDKKAGRRDERVVKALNETRMSYGLSEFSLQSYATVLQKRYKRDIDSGAAQKIATAVWESASSVLFGKGKRMHFRSFHDIDSIEGKSNNSGIRYINGRLEWNKKKIPVQHDKKDVYEELALRHRIKYCRIKRKVVGTKYHFYLELILEGIPPAKHIMNEGRTGIDIGTSTIAAYSDDGACILDELASGIEDIDKKKRALNRKMDRSRRAMNPQNYNEDGTVKKGRKKWKLSNTYRKDRMKYKELCRKRAAAVRQSHEALANKILEHGTTVMVEKMSFAGLAKKAKKTERNKKGKFKKKKRFGKSIQSRAPAMLISIIDRKLHYIGKEIIKVNTKKFRASQYNHVTDTYNKKKLSHRYAVIDGKRIQRDLYSAFLIMNSDDTYLRTDRQKCIVTYQQFCLMHDQCIRDLINSNRKYPSSMGLKYFDTCQRGA